MKKRSPTKLEKSIFAAIVGYFLLMAGALIALTPLQNKPYAGNKIGAAFTGNALRSIGELHRAPSSESALRALHSLQITVTAYQYSDGYSRSQGEDEMLVEMKTILAKKLVAPPTDNCTDAVECYMMSESTRTLPDTVVADVNQAFQKSKVLAATATAHAILVSEISNKAGHYINDVAAGLILGFVGLLAVALVFLFGLDVGRKQLEVSSTSDSKSTAPPDAQ